MTTKEIKKLFNQLKLGDKHAINLLFEKYSSRLYNFAFSYLKTEDDAKDVVQEVFIKLWEKREVLHQNSNIEAYLFHITKNAVISIFRKKVSEKKYLEYLQETTIQEQHEYDQQSDYDYLLKKIQQIVEQLPEQRKRIFKMNYFDGATNKTIAKELNISVKTVEDHITKARRFVKRELNQCDINGILFFYLFL